MKLIYTLFLISFCSYALATDWEALAQKDMNTPSGKAYGNASANFFMEEFVKVAETCIGKQVPSEINLYFKIQSNGHIAEKFTTGNARIANCLSEKLGALTWPTPPSSPFVLKISMFGHQ